MTTGSIPWAPQRTPIPELLGILTASRPAWHADAACREHPDVPFVPDRGDDIRPAKKVCAGCLVRTECLAWALDQDDVPAGIWGGLSVSERRRLRILPRAS